MNEANASERLLGHRIVMLTGKIEEGSIDRMRNHLLTLASDSPEEITLFIDSAGGDAQPGLWLYDCLLLSPVPVIGIVNGRCYSTALIVLQACRRRLATRHSWFLMHVLGGGRMPPMDENFEERLRVKVKQTRKTEEIFEAILSKRTGCDPEEIHRLMTFGERTDAYLYAPQALEAGFIDGIVGDDEKLWRSAD